MSIKEEGYLHDYIATGLIGFAVGIAAASALIVYMVQYAAVAHWGEVIGLGFVAGVFGFLPGGFVAGYLNYRMHKTDMRPMEGFAAGVMALIVHFFITLFVFVAITIAWDASNIMGGWALAFVFGVIFYPIGGYISGILESQAIPMPAVLKFQFIQGAGAPPPPPPGTATTTCPTCGGPLTYIQQYQRWYCYKDKKYV